MIGFWISIAASVALFIVFARIIVGRQEHKWRCAKVKCVHCGARVPKTQAEFTTGPAGTPTWQCAECVGQLIKAAKQMY